MNLSRRNLGIPAFDEDGWPVAGRFEGVTHTVFHGRALNPELSSVEACPDFAGDPYSVRTMMRATYTELLPPFEY